MGSPPPSPKSRALADNVRLVAELKTEIRYSSRRYGRQKTTWSATLHLARRRCTRC